MKVSFAGALIDISLDKMVKGKGMGFVVSTVPAMSLRAKINAVLKLLREALVRPEALELLEAREALVRPGGPAAREALAHLEALELLEAREALVRPGVPAAREVREAREAL